MQTTDTNIESDVSVPRQVRERAERARQLLQPESDQSVVTPEPQSAAPESAPPAATQPDIPTGPDLLEAAPGKENDPAYWRHRASAINGFWKADKTRFLGQIDTLKKQVSDQALKIAQLEAAKPVTTEDIDLTAYFSPEQIEELGEAQCKAVAETARKMATQTVQAQVKALVEPLQQERADEAKRAQEAREAEFFAALTELFPNWQAVDADDRWKAWLRQMDSATGFERQDLLERAMSRGDAPRVAGMLNQFMDTLGQATPVPPEPPVVPAGSAAGVGGGSPATAVTSYPTRAEIKAFYTRAAQNKVTAEERRQFDARVAAAQAAGVL